MQNNNWKRDYFTILGGQAVSLITSGALQMALIFYLTAKTESAFILSAASLRFFYRMPCLALSSGCWWTGTAAKQ